MLSAREKKGDVKKVNQWDVRILPNKRSLFVHQHDWHAQLFVSTYKRGIATASLLGRDTIEDFVKSAVTALNYSNFEFMLKLRYLTLRRLKAVRLDFGFTTLLVTKEWLSTLTDPCKVILDTAQNTVK